MGTGENDYEAVENLAIRRSPDPDADIARWIEEATSLVDRHWPQVEALAAALLERHTLTEAEVKALIPLLVHVEP
jgi:hypothetical protein